MTGFRDRFDHELPALDHFVLSARDLDAAAECYGRLGFHVMPRMRHLDLGTSNHVIQFRDTYLELIGDLHLSPPLLRDRMLHRFDAGDGLSINSLTSTDLEADHERIEAAGLGPERIVSARRKVTLPDGSEDETDSSCFYIWRDGKEYLSLFYSCHYKPDAIFIPEYYGQHENGIEGIYGVVYVSNEPQDDETYLTALFGHGPDQSDADYLRYDGGRGDMLEVCTPDRLRAVFPGVTVPEPLPLPGFAVGLRIWARSLGATADWLQQHHADTERDQGRVLVPPDLAMGAALEVVGRDALPATYRAFADRS
jgi:hypothetical protein